MQKAIIIVFIISILYMLKKVGLNRKLLSIVLGTFSGVVVSTGIMLLAKNSDMVEVGLAFLGICLFVAFHVISNLDRVNSKTEDISWKKLFRKGIIIGLNNCLLMLNMIFLAYFITQQRIDFTISSSVGMMFTVVISALLYSVFNGKKTIYKTVSSNKLEGKRSLKL